MAHHFCIQFQRREFNGHAEEGFGAEPGICEDFSETWRQRWAPPHSSCWRAEDRKISHETLVIGHHAPPLSSIQKGPSQFQITASGDYAPAIAVECDIDRQRENLRTNWTTACSKLYHKSPTPNHETTTGIMPNRLNPTASQYQPQTPTQHSHQKCNSMICLVPFTKTAP
jgi:hypothetical protein